MAAKFKKGETVKLAIPTPQGPVEAFRVDDDGNMHYLVSWVDADGQAQQRWFSESQLESAG